MNQLSERSHSNRLLVWATLPPALVLAVSALSILGSSTPNHTPPPSKLASTTDQHFPLEISPDPIEFGTLNQGEVAQASLRIQNNRSAPVTIERLETSCPCISMEPIPLHIGPHETQTLTVNFNPSTDGEYEGRLGVQVTSYLTGGVVGFRTEVKLNIGLGLEGRE